MDYKSNSERISNIINFRNGKTIDSRCCCPKQLGSVLTYCLVVNGGTSTRRSINFAIFVQLLAHVWTIFFCEPFQKWYQVKQLPINIVKSKPITNFDAIQRLQLKRLCQIIDYDDFIVVLALIRFSFAISTILHRSHDYAQILGLELSYLATGISVKSMLYVLVVGINCFNDEIRILLLSSGEDHEIVVRVQAFKELGDSWPDFELFCVACVSIHRFFEMNQCLIKIQNQNKLFMRKFNFRFLSN